MHVDWAVWCVKGLKKSWRLQNVFVGLVFIGTMFKVVCTDTLMFMVYVNMSTPLTSELNKETYLIDVK
jgi:hypothetical protein